MGKRVGSWLWKFNVIGTILISIHLVLCLSEIVEASGEREQPEWQFRESSEDNDDGDRRRRSSSRRGSDEDFEKLHFYDSFEGEKDQVETKQLKKAGHERDPYEDQLDDKPLKPDPRVSKNCVLLQKKLREVKSRFRKAATKLLGILKKRDEAQKKVLEHEMKRARVIAEQEKKENDLKREERMVKRRKDEKMAKFEESEKRRERIEKLQERKTKNEDQLPAFFDPFFEKQEYEKK
eukprot:TRINITY_DN6828_c0_g1_i1.p1 TRINITY_DN6828_c0_g1~~TRINITY_DN6828_c0_g1_i1.p1  ORF type:complete len:251 (+),score=81.23 TRINITY_DN6828_c0_g1_i1:46-753(+)